MLQRPNIPLIPEMISHLSVRFGHLFSTSKFLLSSRSLADWSSSWPLSSRSSNPRTSASHSLRLWFTMMSICLMSSWSSGSQDVRTELRITWKHQITNMINWRGQFTNLFSFRGLTHLLDTWHHDPEEFPKMHPFGSQRYSKDILQRTWPQQTWVMYMKPWWGWCWWSRWHSRWFIKMKCSAVGHTVNTFTRRRKQTESYSDTDNTWTRTLT